jgi:hypothetical protein
VRCEPVEVPFRQEEILLALQHRHANRGGIKPPRRELGAQIVEPPICVSLDPCAEVLHEERRWRPGRHLMIRLPKLRLKHLRELLGRYREHPLPLLLDHRTRSSSSEGNSAFCSSPIPSQK